jgi:glycosyltransferase involved in cell wall biosynthesis
LKLLHVASGRLFGGVEQMLVTLARSQGLAGVRSSFAVAAPRRLADELRCAGAELCLLGDVRLRQPASVVLARARLRRQLSTERPDFVVYHAPWAFALFAPVGNRAGLPSVFWQHDAAGHSLLERWARWTRAHLVIANSEWTARSAHFVQPTARVEVVPCPVPCVSPGATRDAVRQSLGTDSADVVVLMASRFERWKGHGDLIEAVAALDDLPAWTLWIAGAPQRSSEMRYEYELEQQIARLGIGRRVRFIGERRDVPAIMAAADILCQPNRAPEPFGIVFAEAMLSGLPVITAAAGGAPEVISEQCGRLIQSGDRAALQCALRELIGSPDSRRRMAAAGRVRAINLFDPATVLARLKSVLGSATVRAAA